MHEAVVANGAAAESFVDYNGRSGFDNYDEYRDLAGADRHIAEMPLVRICSQRLLPSELREFLGIDRPFATVRAVASGLVMRGINNSASFSDPCLVGQQWTFIRLRFS